MEVERSRIFGPDGEILLRNPDSEVPFFAKPEWKNPSRYSDSDMEAMIREVKEELLEKEHTKGLETLYCVDIQTDAVDLACSIVGRYYDAIMFKREKVRGCIPDVAALKVEVLQMLQSGCLELINNLDKDAELTHLGIEGYLLFRNRVELCQFRKEKCEFSFNHLLHLEKEYQILRKSWDKVVENCRAILVWQKNPQRRAQIEQLRDHVCKILNSDMNEDEIILALQDICAVVDEYKRSIPAFIMQYRTVSPRSIAKIASLATGVPTSWLLNYFQPPLNCLFDRLARRVVGQDHVIKSIVNIMTSPRKRVPSPLASFLFLPSNTLGAIDLFESLAEELYDSKDRLIRINLSKYTDCASSSDVGRRKHIRKKQRICKDKKSEIREKVLKILRKTPFCALLFENVKGYKFITDFLEDLMTYGGLADAEGNVYELSNTLILMTSNIGENEAKRLSCKCLEMDCPMAAAAMEAIYSMDHECDILPFQRMVLRKLGYISPLVDDVLVLNFVSVLDKGVIARMRLREVIDASWENHELILYPSEFALRLLTTFREKQSNGTTANSCPVILIDHVGDGHVSVFGALLSMLDHGALENREGQLVDFCKTVIIIMTDLVSKDLLALLAGHDIETAEFVDENDDEGREKPFRFELLNRVDEILMFDPVMEAQLGKFLRLPLKVDPKRKPLVDILFVVAFLFTSFDGWPAEMRRHHIGIAASFVSNAISRETEGDASLTNRELTQ